MSRAHMTSSEAGRHPGPENVVKEAQWAGMCIRKKGSD